jgi:hypothetical protein
LCAANLLPKTRQKDIHTALKYLAASYEERPETLPLTEGLEATYREQLLHYFEVHPKGKSTIRNTIQAVGQFLKAMHTQTQTAPVPLAQSKGFCCRNGW